MKGTLIQVTDNEGISLGLLYTERELSSQELNELENYLGAWEWDDLEDFAEQANNKGHDLQRVFVEEINP